MKKLFLVLVIMGLIVVLFAGCDSITPGEGEGEGEGEPETVDRVVMVELFMSIGCSSCEQIEPILEQLAEEYNRSQMILVEEAAWGLHSIPEISNRYKWYFPSSSDRSTHNTLFNGLNHRLHQSGNYSTVKSYIEIELNKEAKIAIDADRSSDANTTTIAGTIKNISSSTLQNLVINGMLFRDRGETGLKYLVTDILEEQKVEISALAPEESLDFSFVLEGLNWDADNVHGVIFVQAPDSSRKEILQALYIK